MVRTNIRHAVWRTFFFNTWGWLQVMLTLFRHAFLKGAVSNITSRDPDKLNHVLFEPATSHRWPSDPKSDGTEPNGTLESLDIPTLTGFNLCEAIALPLVLRRSVAA